MPWKFKTESTEPAREPGGCCGDAIGTAENIAELGTESLEGARKAVRALLTSLDPTSTFSVYLFGNSCRPVAAGGSHVIAASADNIRAVTCEVDAVGDMGGTNLFAAVEEVMRLQVPSGRRHNVMILTDGEVGQSESERVRALLAPMCPAAALVGIIGIGNEVWWLQYHVCIGVCNAGRHR